MKTNVTLLLFILGIQILTAKEPNFILIYADSNR